jgi:hypothetical protein
MNKVENAVYTSKSLCLLFHNNELFFKTLKWAPMGNYWSLWYQATDINKRPVNDCWDLKHFTKENKQFYDSMLQSYKKQKNARITSTVDESLSSNQ